MKNLLVTGAAGFIGSHFADLALDKGLNVIVLDSLSYAADMDNLTQASKAASYTFIKGDICDSDLVANAFKEYSIDTVVNFAAESHVDNSIKGPEIFVKSNILGTYNLLWQYLRHWKDNGSLDNWCFLHVSTDEVFGSLELNSTNKFSETTPYDPSSPYSASKASSDHLVRAWNATYGLPTIITNCSNNYGPRQNQEKLIPHMINCALQGKPLPVYGDGLNVRDWIYVKDHCRGIMAALENGTPGESYCFGGNKEIQNIDLVKSICKILNEIKPKSSGKYEDQITFVEDRLGHDRRYAIDDSKARNTLSYLNIHSFEENLKSTILWYL